MDDTHYILKIAHGKESILSPFSTKQEAFNEMIKLRRENRRDPRGNKKINVYHKGSRVKDFRGLHQPESLKSGLHFRRKLLEVEKCINNILMGVHVFSESQLSRHRGFVEEQIKVLHLQVLFLQKELSLMEYR